MKTTAYKCLELFILFVLIPISLVLNYSIRLKIAFLVIGFLYVIFVLLKIERVSILISKGINWKQFIKTTSLKLAVIILLTTLYVYWVDKEQLFYVIKTQPKLWLFILFLYSFFSVFPQELIYRTFFFKRYETLFKNDTVFVLVNAALFALAHLFFGNTLVMCITFLGGLLFALTFKNTKSTTLVSIEHAIYGCWLFTVGMGNMLGFPSE